MLCNFKGRYSDLMKSLFSLVMEYPSIFLPCAGIAYLISCSMDFITFKMEQAPFFAGNNIVGYWDYGL